MNPEAVFNRYDIRGDHPEEIDAEFADRFGAAVGTHALRNGRGKVVVGRDTRDSSQAVHGAFVEGARKTGANIVDIGIGPTDRVAAAASHYGGTGVMVTASHHAWERTGFKLLYERGNGFSNDDLQEVKELFHEEDFEDGDGTLLDEQHEFDEVYAEKVKGAFEDYGELDARVLIDPSGAASRIAPDLFEELGAEVTEHDWSAGPDPEPREGNRADIIERAGEFDVAVGYDPDGDRVYLVHPEIGWVDGDRLFYLLASLTDPERVVASIDTSPLIEETGAEVTYTRVGDIFVAEKGIEVDADLLGEPNGHYALPEFSWYNSGILASLLLASEVERIPEMLEAVEGYSSARRVAEFGTVEERDSAFSDVKKTVAENYEVVSRVDGIKFQGDGFTALARPSGTSPKLRLVVHSMSEKVDPGSVAADLLD